MRTVLTTAVFKSDTRFRDYNGWGHRNKNNWRWEFNLNLLF